MDKYAQSTVAFWETLEKADSSTRSKLDERVREKLSDLQIVVAEALAEVGGTATVAELAARAKLPFSRVLRAGKGLEGKGLAEIRGSGPKAVVTLRL